MIISSLDNIPEGLLEAMRQLSPILMVNNYTQDIKNRDVIQVLDMLNEYLAANTISGFHCTREPENDYFSTYGLRPLNMKSHHAWFVERFGDKFSSDEMSTIQRDWCNYFDSFMCSCRENMIWFCFSPEAIFDDGCDNFFRYFGGEAIYKALSNSCVKKKLEIIGSPVIVEVCVLGKDVVTHQSLGLGLLNTFHRKINQNARNCNVEGYLRRFVSPSEVVRVWSKNEFFANFSV